MNRQSAIACGILLVFAVLVLYGLTGYAQADPRIFERKFGDVQCFVAATGSEVAISCLK